jgi:PAT family beta-lactamase induction signal transducer AmpG
VPTRRSLLDLLNRRMLLCALMGFSSGLPLYVLIQLIPAWLRREGTSLEAIGLFALTQLPYTWKFLWAPLLDRYTLPFLGRRRGWALVTQVGLLLLLLTFGAFDAAGQTRTIAAVALVVAFFSATQDIVLDAYRRELLPDEELGLGNAIYVNTYRVAGLVPGGLALIVADHAPWPVVHATVASAMGVGIFATWLAPDLDLETAAPRSLWGAIVGPFREFFTRQDVGSSLLVLLFLFAYKLGDNMATALATPFYLDLGFSMTEIGTVAKLVGFWSTVIGALVGGAVMTRIGINRALWIFGVVQLVSILGFAALAEVGRNVGALAVVVAFEFLGVGLGTAAFVAFIARATHRSFTATQYALFSSFIALPRSLASAGTGYLVAALGYPRFFLFCTALAIPGLLLLHWVAPWTEPARTDASE